MRQRDLRPGDVVSHGSLIKGTVNHVSEYAVYIAWEGCQGEDRIVMASPLWSGFKLERKK